MKENYFTQEELTQAAARLAFSWSGADSTSVSYEKAEELLEAVLYCLKEWEGQEGLVCREKRIGVWEAYQSGKQIAVQKVERLKNLYHERLLDFPDYGLACLRDMIRAIPGFLRWYDVRFAPQNTLLTLDYPVLAGLDGMTGIDKVLAYGQCLDCERTFLEKLEPGYVSEALLTYHPDYRELVENLCSMVLPGIMGHIMLKKPLSNRGFAAEEYSWLESMIGAREKEELEAFLNQIIGRMTETIYGGAKELREYLSQNAGEAALRMKHAAEWNTLNKIFRV